MKNIFEDRNHIMSCVVEKVSKIKDRYLPLIEDCEVDYDKATGVAFAYGIWGYLPDPDNPFDKLPSIVKLELAEAIKSCVDSHLSST